VAPIVINTVSVYSTNQQGYLDTCISHVEYGCVKVGRCRFTPD
jgi:hypothetical protein